MLEKIYLIDTCIWRDFYEDRLSKAGRPLGKYAADLFMKILKNNSRILFSESLYCIAGLKPMTLVSNAILEIRLSKRGA